MSKAGNTLRQRALLSTRLGTRELKPLRFNALMGDGTGGDPKVPDRPNYVYVRIDGRGVVEEVLNVRIVARNDLAIVVGFDQVLPDVLQVLSFDPFFNAALGPYAYGTAPHHVTHELLNPNGGDDVVWVQSKQFLPLLCHPSIPNALTVEVFEGWYAWMASWHYFAAATSPNLVASVPGIAAQARFVLISIDGATEALQTTDGALFAEFLPPPDMEDQIPAAPAGSVPIAAVYLVFGQTTIDTSDIYDLRLFAQPVGGSVAPAAHDILSAEHGDTDPNAVLQGAMMVGDATPEWARFAAGIAHAILKMNAGGTDPVWVAFDWDDLAAAAGADMAHDHSAAGEGGGIPLASLDDYTQGDIVYGGAADWDDLPIGGVRFLLLVNAAGTEPEWLAFDWDILAAAAGADMVHDHSAAGEGGEIPLASLSDYTQGDIIYGGAADYQDLAVGNIGDVLTVNGAGTEPEWAAPGGAAHDILSATHTDSDPNAVLRGALMVGDATPEWARFPIGAAGRVLTVNAGGTDPEWAVAGGGGRAADDYYGNNLIKNSPGQIAVDGAEPQWWDDVANATITDEDTAGEAPPDIHERCFKVVTTANDVYGYQTFTLADEEVLDAGVTIVSFGCWVYCTTGAKASIGIFGTNLTLQESAQAGAGAWEWLEVNNITLNAADATIQVRLIVDTDTAWFTMPMFAVGPAAQPWIPRGIKEVESYASVLVDSPHTETLAWTDLDVTATTDPLAVSVVLGIHLSNNNIAKDWFFHLSSNYTTPGTTIWSTVNRTFAAGHAMYIASQSEVPVDDANIFEYYSLNNTDATTLTVLRIYQQQYRMWI